MDILTGQVSLAGEDALMGARRKRYTPAYRRDAARLVIDTGRTIVEVAREIDVGEALLGRWVAAERARMEDPPGALDVDERAELERLRAESAQLPSQSTSPVSPIRNCRSRERRSNLPRAMPAQTKLIHGTAG